MSKQTTPDAVGQSNLPSNSQTTGPNNQNTSQPETTSGIIARAREIIAGQLRPSSLESPPSVVAFLEREFERLQPPPTSEAVRQVTNHLNLQAHYGGRPVACFTTTDGTLAVLASGEQEIRSLLKGLTEEEKALVVIEHPDEF